MAGTFTYGRVEHDGEGGSRMVEVALEQHEAVIAVNVPPMLVSAPIPATSVVFVEVPDGADDWEWHPAPRVQLVVVLEGVIEAETTDGRTERAGPGGIVLAADLEGRGHISRVLERPCRFLMIPLAE